MRKYLHRKIFAGILFFCCILFYAGADMHLAGENGQAAYRQDSGEIGRVAAGISGDGYGAAEVKTLADATGEYIAELNRIRMSGKAIVGLETGFRDRKSTRLNSSHS